jgi:putative endopeptidase
MRVANLLSIAVIGALAVSARAQQPSIRVGDLDRSADPCTDFYRYANGTWRTNNPIPASMSHWSRRWKAGEEAKTQLKGILDAVSRRTDWPRSSAEQLIGNFYGSCVDETRIEKAGPAAAAPMLREIAGMKAPRDLQRVILDLQNLGVGAPFRLNSSPDYHDPTTTIASVSASGLGLPDRDYYVKTEPRFQEARAKYLLHVAHMFRLTGANERQAKSAAQTVFQIEKKLAEASLDNVALRNPQATDHKMSLAELTKLAPAVDWRAYFSQAGKPRADLNVTEPKFLLEVNRQFQETPLERKAFFQSCARNSAQKICRIGAK